MPARPAVYVLLILITIILMVGCSQRDQLRVVKVTPEENAPRETNISIEFSHDVVPSDSIGAVFDDAGVTFDPPLNGRFRWSDRRTLEFLPVESLRPATRYMVRVDESIALAANANSAGVQEFTLSTKPLNVGKIYPELRPAPENQDLVVLHAPLNFTAEVDGDELREHLQFKLNGEPLEFNFEVDGTRENFLLISAPFEENDRNAEFQIVIEEGLQAAQGNMPLDETVRFTYSLKSIRRIEFKITRVAPVQQNKQYFISIDFTSSVDPSSAEEYIEIEPAQETTIVSGNTRQLLIDGPFKPGDEVRIVVREGLPAENGLTLREEFSQQVTFPQLRPSIDFSHSGNYLPRSGLGNVELEVVSIDTIHIEIAKIYPNNLVHFLHQGGIGYGYFNLFQFGRELYDEDMAIVAADGADLPVPTPVTINLLPMLDQHSSGLFSVTVRGQNRYYRRAQRTVLLTDIGLIAKQSDDAVHVWALSLDDLKPISGAVISLLSSTNQLIGSESTNQSGYVQLPFSKAQKVEFSPFVVRAEKDDDFSFLQFSGSQISMGDFPVDGQRLPNEGFRAFLYGDRDAYRPGETVHVASVLRAVDGSVPDNFPVTLKVFGPQGRLINTQRGRAGLENMTTFDVEIPYYARTGRYRAHLYSASDQPTGTYEFHVEEFIPDRIKVEIGLDQEEYNAGETIETDVIGTMLFGPPASGNRTEAKITLEARAYDPVQWPRYTFGDNNRLESSRQPLPGEQGSNRWSSIERRLGDKTLDADGKVQFTFTIPSDLRPPAALTGIVSATVHEDGGRAVTSRASTVIHPYPHYLGLRPMKDDRPEPGQKVEFEAVAVTPDGEAVTVDGVSATLYKWRWQNTLQNARGSYRYRSVRVAEEHASHSLDLSDKSTTFEFTPSTYGSYMVVLEDPASGARTSYDFYVSGWGYSSWAMDEPDRLQLELDREQYQVGQTAKIMVRAPFSGKLLLTVERDDVVDQRLVDLSENTAEIEIPVKKDYGPNMYITGLLVRTPDGEDPHTPSRAFGTIPLMIDMTGKQIDVNLNVPETMRPRSELTVDIELPGIDGTAAVTVAAVDEGILQLTGYASANPMQYFYGKRALDVTSHDIFSQLLPDVEQAMLHSSPAGGKMMMEMGHLSGLTQHRVKPVALWSGILEAENGEADVSFDIPEYNGSLRVMAVAVQGNRFGAAAKNVTVRAPIVLTPTLPRFAAGGDEFIVPVTTYNDLGRQAEIDVQIDVSGPLKVKSKNRQSIILNEGGEAQLRFELSAERANSLAHITISASGGGERVRTDIDLPVRPPVQPKAITGAGSIKAGQTAQITIPDEFLDGTASYSLHLMSAPVLEFGGELEWLLEYPYGCLEQTVSRAFPLLWFHEVARRIDPDRYEETAPEYYVQEAVDKVVALQNDRGGFDFWPGPYTRHFNVWAAIYASHFLAEARGEGYPVPSETIRSMKNFLELAGSGGFDASPEQQSWRSDKWYYEQNARVRAYALFVLALLDDPDRGAMNHLRRQYDEWLEPDSRALLGGAYALDGDWATARSLLPQQTFPVRGIEHQQAYTFNSPVRTDAIVLYVLASHAPANALVPVLLQRIRDNLTGQRMRYTTHATGWTMAALGKLYARTERSEYDGEIRNNGESLGAFSEDPFTLTDSTLAGKTIEIDVHGNGICYYYWEARGLPRNRDFSTVNEGIRVRRIWRSMDGGDIISVNNVQQGEMYVAEITIESLNDQWVENVVIDDMLPAGFEIENPRLESREQVSWLPNNRLAPMSMDIRDDRILIFVDVPANNDRSFYYVVRAVAPGSFVLPQVMAEAMYDPTLHSRSSSGTVQVKMR